MQFKILNTILLTASVFVTTLLFTAPVSAATTAQISAAQETVSYCTSNAWRATIDGALEEARVTALCDDNNAAELAEVCSGTRELDTVKFYGERDEFINELCNAADPLDSVTGEPLDTTSEPELATLTLALKITSDTPDTGYENIVFSLSGNSLDSPITRILPASDSLTDDRLPLAFRDLELGEYTLTATNASGTVVLQSPISITESGQIIRNFDLNADRLDTTDIDRLNGTVGDGEDTDDDDSCEGNGGAFSFIGCEILDFANDGISWVDDQIITRLNIEEAYYKNDNVRDAWANIRNVSFIVLIPILLVMVIGTALGFSFLDAYTVKRALPRLFIAVIFMAISFDALVELVDFVQVIGIGIAGLIASPFGGFDNLSLTAVFTGTETVAAGVGVLAGVGLYAITSVSLGILGSFMLTIFGVLLIIFFLLALRELLIVFLLIMAPFAIISWIFPGNDKLWKLWWSTFSKLLLLFPVVMGLLAAGRSFARLVQVTDDEGGIITSLIKLTAFVGPYFFIPSAFRFAGGAFANLAGVVNDRGKGFFDTRKKNRAEARKGLRERNEGGKRFAGGNENNFRGKLNRRISRGYAAAGAVKEGGISRFAKDAKTGINAIEARNHKKHRDHILEDKDLAEWLGYDDLTGISAAVASGDRETLTTALREKYKFKGDVDATVDEILNLKKSGNLEGALRKAYDAADDERNTTERFTQKKGGKYVVDGSGGYRLAIEGEEGTHDNGVGERAFLGDENFKNVSLRQVTNAFRKYGDTPLIQAMQLKAAGGGTFYRNSGDAYDALLRTTMEHGQVDRNSLADMTVQIRKMLMSAGRIEGAISFGGALGHMGKLEQIRKSVEADGTYTFTPHGSTVEDGKVTVAGQEIAVGANGQVSLKAGDNGLNASDIMVEARRQLNFDFMNKVYEQKGSAIFTHPDIKTGYIEDNAIPVIRQRIVDARQRAEAAGQIQTVVENDGSTREIILSEEYKREVANAENLIKTLGNSKPELIKVFGEQVFNMDVSTGRSLSPQEIQMQHDAQLNYANGLSKFRKDKKAYDEIIERLREGATSVRLPDGNMFNAVFDSQGKVANMPPPPVEPERPPFIATVRSDIGLLQNDPVYQNFSYQWQQTENEWRNQIRNSQMEELLEEQRRRMTESQQGLSGDGSFGQGGIGGQGL